MLRAPVKTRWLKLPISTSALPFHCPNAGRQGMILTEPAVAFRPRNVPCGPTLTSTREISKKTDPIPVGRGM